MPRKIYAVRAGRKPGIYNEWFGPDGAEAQVKGVSGAAYKGFPYYDDNAAKQFMASKGGPEVLPKKKPRARKKLPKGCHDPMKNVVVTGRRWWLEPDYDLRIKGVWNTDKYDDKGVQI